MKAHPVHEIARNQVHLKDNSHWLIQTVLGRDPFQHDGFVWLHRVPPHRVRFLFSFTQSSSKPCQSPGDFRTHISVHMNYMSDADDLLPQGLQIAKEKKKKKSCQRSLMWLRGDSVKLSWASQKALWTFDVIIYRLKKPELSNVS